MPSMRLRSHAKRGSDRKYGHPPPALSHYRTEAMAVPAVMAVVAVVVAKAAGMAMVRSRRCSSRSHNFFFDDARGPGDGGANLSVAKTPVGNVPAVVAGTPIPSGIDNAHVPWACGIRPVFILPVGGPVGLAPVEPPRLCLRAQAGVALGDGESQGATGPNILIAGASGVDSRLWVSCIVRVALADVLTTDHERHATSVDQKVLTLGGTER
eukprot:3382467-Prymnesium_polylepis.2